MKKLHIALKQLGSEKHSIISLIGVKKLFRQLLNEGIELRVEFQFFGFFNSHITTNIAVMLV